MRRTREAALFATLIALAGLLLASPIQAQERPGFVIQPPEEPQQAVLETPERFSWERFLEQSTLEFIEGDASVTEIEKESQGISSKVQVIAVVIRDGEVVDRLTSETFTVPEEIFLTDVVSGEFVQALEKTVRGYTSTAVFSNTWARADRWTPTSGWERQQLPQMVAEAVAHKIARPAAKQQAPSGMRGAPGKAIQVVLYATFADEELRERSTTRPVGIFLQRRK